MTRLVLCQNCLSPGAQACPVGYERGSQRDPTQDSVTLCETCTSALTAGDFATLSARYATERTIKREGS